MELFIDAGRVLEQRAAGGRGTETVSCRMADLGLVSRLMGSADMQALAFQREGDNI